MRKNQHPVENGTMIEIVPIVKVATVKASDLRQMTFIPISSWDWCGGTIVCRKGERAPIHDVIGWYININSTPSRHMLIQDRDTGQLLITHVPIGLYKHVTDNYPQLFVR